MISVTLSRGNHTPKGRWSYKERLVYRTLFAKPQEQDPDWDALRKLVEELLSVVDKISF